MSDQHTRRAEYLLGGRSCMQTHAWQQARAALEQADGIEPLGAADLERLADACYLMGDEDGFFTQTERAYRQRMEAGEPAAALRCAFWMGLHGMFRGEVGKAGGWFGRAGRLLPDLGDCPEAGYVLLPRVHQLLGAGELAAAERTADEARELGARHGDAALEVIALHLQGRALLELGRVHDGLAALDETMLAVVGDELPPRITGLLYCSVIEACQLVHAIDRAAEWTEALRGWCEAQPDLAAFTGKCLIHRAEILQLGGAWEDAIAEARRACERIALGPKSDSPGAALYQEAEVHRMRGELSAAEATYGRAAEAGADPQPGLALLRLQQGERRGAAASIRRAVEGAQSDIARSRLLPACAEIMLASGEVDDARAAADALDKIANRFATEMVGAMALQCRGAVLLATGEAGQALRALDRAHSAWQRLRVPYEAARTKSLLAKACAESGDEDGRRMHAEAAQAGFKRLGAAVTAGADGTRGRNVAAGGLSGREIEVIQLVASGKTNREIASALSLSVKTIDRHVSNILGKLDVSSRAAATAYAYEHGLL